MSCEAPSLFTAPKFNLSTHNGIVLSIQNELSHRINTTVIGKDVWFTLDNCNIFYNGAESADAAHVIMKNAITVKFQLGINEVNVTHTSDSGETQFKIFLLSKSVFPATPTRPETSYYRTNLKA